eukprot:sb/3467585/
MKLCGEGDANALDSFLTVFIWGPGVFLGIEDISHPIAGRLPRALARGYFVTKVNPESLKRTGNSYLGVMASMKNHSMKITSSKLPTDTSKLTIRTRYLRHVTGDQPIRDQCARADCPLSCALRVDRMDVAEYLVSQGASVGEALMRLAGCTDRRLANLLGVRLAIISTLSWLRSNRRATYARAGKGLLRYQTSIAGCCTVNMTVSRDPDMQALWRLISPQILVLTTAPLESAFLFANSFTNVFPRVSTNTTENPIFRSEVQHLHFRVGVVPVFSGHYSDQRRRISGGRCRN